MQSFRDRRQTFPRAELLPPDQTPRSARSGPRARSMDVVDVSFETIVEAPSQRRPAFAVGNDNARAADALGARPAGTAGHGAASEAVLRAEGRLRSLSGWMFTTVVALCGAGTFTLALATAAGPVATAPVQRAPLTIISHGHMIEDRGGLKVLSVYGSIENTTTQPLAVPGVRVEMISAGRRVVLGDVPPGDGMIAPGAAQRFSARLPHAGGKVSDLALSVAGQGVAAR
ncbi:hypothetical protein SAMN05880582_1011566 [Rhizobium sp. RU20A]|uniref:hypothetical protein n=1 Tax=Rhizobium sp. RU20A TaxID=1907412 RepID=UPI00095463FA|nr:hypothetical protein [Rhizobium sp. RU20A]SIQ35115.1 hypothetical protein SAMN05880582_1011566 [Rhizobium sp. RU20A]